MLPRRAVAPVQGPVAQGVWQDRRCARCQSQVLGRQRQGLEGVEGIHVEMGGAGAGREVAY